MYKMPKSSRVIFAAIILGAVLVLFQGMIVSARAGSDFMLKKQVSVSGEYVRFVDIAEPITDAGRNLWPEIKENRLWKAPASGRRVVKNRNRLRRAVHRHVPAAAGRCLYPRETILQKGDRVLGPEEIQKKIVSFLTPFVRNMGEKVEFREFRLPEAIFLSNESEELVLEKGSRGIGPGRNNFRLKVVNGYGDERNTYSGSVFIDVWKTVPCTARPINRREPITPDAVRFERKNLAYVQGEVWDGKSGNWMASRSMGQGQCLTEKYMDPLPILKRGEKAELLYQGDFIRLSVPVEVLSDAGRGDEVRVRNLQSDKELTARVRDGNTVVIR
jgi:flagella basal body P-ring formation protein FlgA